MKKNFCIVLCFVCIAVCFAGCGSSDSDSVVVDPNAGTSETQSADSSEEAMDTTVTEHEDVLYYESNGVKIRPYDLIEDVMAELGEPDGTFEAASCAYQGSDYFYYYDGFELTVNDLDDEKHVTVINVVDDTVSIPQGVKIGSTEEEMLACMGDDYTVETGVYRFAEDTTTLQIQIEEGSVVLIMYVYTPQE